MPRRKPNPVIADDILEHQLNLLRLEAGTRKKAYTILNQLQKELTTRLRSENLTSFSKARLKDLLAEAKDTIEGRYEQVQSAAEKALSTTARTSAKNVATTLERTLAVVDISAGLPTATFIERIASNAVIMGAPSEEWWARQAQDTAFRFSNAVRQGLAAGDTTEVIVARVAGGQGYAGIMDISRANARSLVHTSIQEVANESRMETFRQNDDIIEAVEQLSTLDGNTTDICIAYSGMQWTLDEEPIGDALPFDGGPPRHWGCRSVLVPVTKSFKELGIDIAEPKELGMTFEEFLSRRTEAQQDEQLGAGRAQMWRDGTITLPQLLDQRGNPLTLSQLEEMHG